MIILGIDPGTATTGYGAIETTKRKGEHLLKDFGVITTKSNLSDSQRLLVLGKDIEDLIKTLKPGAIGVEKLFFTTNQKTAMTVSQARGVVLYLAEKSKIPVFELTPLQVKNFICGYGKAEKKQVQYMVQQIFKLKSPPKPDDAADAVAVALYASHVFQKKHLQLK